MTTIETLEQKRKIAVNLLKKLLPESEKEALECILKAEREGNWMLIAMALEGLESQIYELRKAIL